VTFFFLLQLVLRADLGSICKKIRYPLQVCFYACFSGWEHMSFSLEKNVPCRHRLWTAHLCLSSA